VFVIGPDSFSVDKEEYLPWYLQHWLLRPKRPWTQILYHTEYYL